MAATRSTSPLEQRFSAAPLAKLCGNLDPYSGDFALQFGDICFEFRDPHQGQIFRLRRLASRFEIRLIHAVSFSFRLPWAGVTII